MHDLFDLLHAYGTTDPHDVRVEYARAVDDAIHTGALRSNAARLARVLPDMADVAGVTTPPISWRQVFRDVGIDPDEGQHVRGWLKLVGMLASDGEGGWYLMHPDDWVLWPAGGPQEVAA